MKCNSHHYNLKYSILRKILINSRSRMKLTMHFESRGFNLQNKLTIVVFTISFCKITTLQHLMPEY